MRYLLTDDVYLVSNAGVFVHVLSFINFLFLDGYLFHWGLVLFFLLDELLFWGHVRHLLLLLLLVGVVILLPLLRLVLCLLV